MLMLIGIQVPFCFSEEWSWCLQTESSEYWMSHRSGSDPAADPNPYRYALKPSILALPRHNDHPC